MENKSSTKTIAKNTLFLYFRMMLTMAISLYTSRVVLQTIGVDDFGIYQSVGGIVGFMAFLNGALSTGSSRFLTYALGENNPENLQKTFSTVFFVHLVLALLIICVAETFGLWFLYNKMVIPVERMDVAIWVFHLSIITAAINITQVPYSGCITAHENFNLYAYVSIVEAVLKLLIVYLLTIGSYDKLILYAILLFLLQVILQIFYRIYCRMRFDECKLQFRFDKNIFAPIAKFSGWSLFSNITIALNNQGVLLLLNLFFSPAIVAARAISLQVDGMIKQFVNNFNTASNPQIIKRYAAGDFDGSKTLMFQTSSLSFYLMLVLSVPICIFAPSILSIWLEDVPEYTVIFLQLIIIQNLFEVIGTCFYRAFNAAGRLKENTLATFFVNGFRFFVIYFLFKMGSSPLALSFAGIVTHMILSLLVKPYLMVKHLNYKVRDFLIFIPCVKVTLITIVVSYFLSVCCFKDLFSNRFLELFIGGGVIFLFTSSVIWLLGLDAEVKSKIIGIVIKKLKSSSF